MFAVDTPVLGLNYGLDRVRFPTAVPAGSRVRARGRLARVVRVSDGVQTTVGLVYEVEGAEKPPCVAEVVSRRHIN
jgi:acyl dehydratase